MAFSYDVSDGAAAFKSVLRLTTLNSELSLRAALLTTDVTIYGWTPRMAAEVFYDYAKSTTSVAVSAYQFFTGLTPFAAGLDHLVNSPNNLTDLNDRYYTRFSMENRYINFAANLGVGGEGRDAFVANYGALSFVDAVAKAYDQIIGFGWALNAGIEPGVAILDIAARQAYFRTLAGGGDIGAKAGMVGYIMAEAVKAKVGHYARALENFYLDLSDGSAEHHVDLVGIYGHGSTLDGVG